MLKRLKMTVFVLFCFLAAGQFVGKGAYSQDAPAEKFFKNIQALKGVPAGQIASLMDSYNKALGVSCEYCHVAGDLSKADKPAHKSSVRDIMMTREINDKYKHSVDCMSCHQGKAKPTTTVIAKRDTGPITPPQPDKPGTKTEPTKPDKTAPPSKAEADPPTMVTYAASYGKVLFPHDKHMSIYSDCSKCHHTGENNKCDTCHLHNKKTSAVTQVTFYAAAHGTKSERACTACHLQSKAGPTKCSECHKK